MKHISSLLVAVALLCGAGMANGQESEEVRLFKAEKIKAEQGIALAQYNLGLMYAKGEGVPQDYVEAVKWFRKAAEQGSGLAQDRLDSLYHKGMKTNDEEMTNKEFQIWMAGELKSFRSYVDGEFKAIRAELKGVESKVEFVQWVVSIFVAPIVIPLVIYFGKFAWDAARMKAQSMFDNGKGVPQD